MPVILPETFFHCHSVCTGEEPAAHLAANDGAGAEYHEPPLAYHTRAKHLTQERRGLFAVIPPVVGSGTYSLHPNLVAAK